MNSRKKTSKPLIILMALLTSLAACKKADYNGPLTELIVEEVQAPAKEDPLPEDPGQEIDPETGGDLHPVFNGKLGMKISGKSMEKIAPDRTGLTICQDIDGDGIPNTQEIVTNPYVSNFPRIVARISPPITMEIRIDENIEEENYKETLTETDLKETIKNSMENKHYKSEQYKTTPYITKESLSKSGKHAEAYGHSQADTTSAGKTDNIKTGTAAQNPSGAVIASVDFEYKRDRTKSKGTESSRNSSIEDQFSRSTMTEKTVFKDIDFTDNLDKNGIEYTNDTVEEIINNYRKDEKLKKNENIGPNAGIVRASMFLKNVTLDMPAHITNVICTLSFRTPAGQFLPVKTFRLKNLDYTNFSQKIYGGEELGPFAIEVKNLNTYEIRVALANAYVPQIHVVSFDMTKVDGSNYDPLPGNDNLKIVEEITKGRTALIKIIGSGMREIYRVPAFDYDPANGISPGVSLKKALFHIFHDRIGDGETWETDAQGKQLTVPDDCLKWKAGAPDPDQYIYTDNKTGNKWRKFETYVKTFVDEYDKVQSIETIKRIEELNKFNPFNPKDNPTYNPNEAMTRDEVLRMKFWVVFCNGRYYEGNINDPIWAGERYEIILMDMLDFNEHYKNYVYTPFQTGERIFFDTRWNTITEEKGEFARAVYLGKVLPGDVIQLEINLLKTRFLFNENTAQNGFGTGDPAGRYYNLDYKFQKEEPAENELPGEFTHSAEGGTNNIRVTIEESEYAESYKITYYPWPQTDPATPEVTINVPKSEFEEKSGVITLCSRTQGIDFIPGSNGGAGMSYRVDVYAAGSYFGTAVTKKSSTPGAIAYVRDYREVGTPKKPERFDYGTLVNINNIEVRINDSKYTEYFNIKCEGPVNYSISAVKEQTGHAGSNIVQLATPPRAELEDPANDFAAGLYAIEVFARNAEVTDDSISAYSGKVFLKVEYDRYAGQKIHAPEVSSTLFGLDCIDFEVNFNDGSGWIPLQITDTYQDGVSQNLPYTDFHYDGVIECYYHSHMEKNKQKFFINFTPPAGKYGLPNVFFGDRQIAELYIRTIPKKKYRDSFWLSPALNSNGDPVTNYSNYNEADRYYGLGTGLQDPVEYWLSGCGYINADTDAVNFEENAAAYISDNVLNGNNGHILSLDDFFFSPAEQRQYALKANVNNEMEIIPGWRPQTPLLIADVTRDSSGAKGIELTVIATRAETYDTYIYTGIPKDIAGIISDAKADETGLWTSGLEEKKWTYMNSMDVNITTNVFWELEVDETYTFCVFSTNNYGVSIPEFRSISIPVDPPLEAGTPYSDVSDFYYQKKDPSDASKRTITIHSLRADNTSETGIKFTSYWKRASDSGDYDSNIWTKTDAPPGSDTISFSIDSGITELINIHVFALNNNGEKCPSPLVINIKPVIEVELQQITTMSKARGVIESPSGQICTDRGKPVTQYTYGTPMLNIYDTQNKGPLNAGKYLRIVHNSVNIAKTNGLNLQPVAMDLQHDITPPKNQCYIDPARRIFIMPRPSYWSNWIVGPNIIEHGRSTSKTLGPGTVWHGAGLAPVEPREQWARIDSFVSASQQYTISFYGANFGYQTDGIGGSGAGSTSQTCFYFAEKSYVVIENSDIYELSKNTRCRIVINDSTAATSTEFYSYDFYGGQLFHHFHIYIYIDKTRKLLGNSRSVVVVIKDHNDNEIGIDTQEPIGTLIEPYVYLWSFYQDHMCKAIMLKLKIWDHIISGNLNADDDNLRIMSTYDNAMHFIYGSENGFQPNLEDAESGIGYFYKE